MTRTCRLTLAANAAIVVGAFAMFAGAGNAQVLYTDFGPGLAFSATGPEFAGFAIGVQFTPSTTALFQDAILALSTDGSATGTDSVYLFHNDNGSNLPGTMIEALPSVMFTNTPTAVTAYSTLHPLLVAGTKYWLVVDASSVLTIWYVNSLSPVVDNTAANFAGTATFPSGWLYSESPGATPAYEIDGVQIAGSGAPFQVRYVSNLAVGDPVINITNDGQTVPTADPVLPTASNLCIGVYTFDANEELQSCCACLVTPNGLVSLSAHAITSTSLTGENPSSLVVKLLAWSTTAGASSTAPPRTPAPPTSSTCNPATPGTIAPGMHAWGTTIHPLPVGWPVHLHRHPRPSSRPLL